MPWIDEKTFAVNGPAARDEFKGLLDQICDGQYVKFKWTFGSRRTLDQNNKLWPMLQDISGQVVYHGKKYTKEQWKDILTGSFLNVEFVPNTENTGMVAIGMSTSGMSRKEFIPLIEFIYAFGDTQGVTWSKKAEETYKDAVS